MRTIKEGKRRKLEEGSEWQWGRIEGKNKSEVETKEGGVCFPEPRGQYIFLLRMKGLEKLGFILF